MKTDETERAKVLVVDDNEANRLLAQHTLEDEGHDVILASGGAAGVAAFEKEPADCVLLDIRMPDMDGFAVCERIRALPFGSDAPVLFLTALRDVDTRAMWTLSGKPKARRSWRSSAGVRSRGPRHTRADDIESCEG